MHKRDIITLTIFMLFSTCVVSAGVVPVPGPDPVAQAGWAKTIALLTKQLKVAQTQLKNVKQHLDLAADLKKLQEGDLRSLSVFRSTTMKKYFDVAGLGGFSETVGVLNDIGKIDQEIANIDRSYQRASGDKKQRYKQNRDFLIARRQLSLIDRENKRNQKRAAQDVNSRASNQVTASSTSGMLDILIRREKQKQNQERVGAEMSSTLGSQIGSGYSAIGSNN